MENNTFEECKNNVLQLMVNKGVYSYVQINSYEQYTHFMTSRIFKTLDLYCPNCKQDKTFLFNSYMDCKFGQRWKLISTEGKYDYIHYTYELIFKCPTCGEEIAFYFYYDETKKRIIKIGQYPSLYDISKDELKQYQKSSLISDDDMKQLYKAYTCASESYFVAAYTYMRRVFENLLSAAFNDNKGEIGLTEEKFRKMRSNEKLEKLKDYLAIDDEIYAPLYALLSVGIHSLTEEECGENFELLKSILLDILAEQKAKKEKKEKRKQIKTLYSKKEAEQKAENNAKDEK